MKLNFESIKRETERLFLEFLIPDLRIAKIGSVVFRKVWPQIENKIRINPFKVVPVVLYMVSKMEHHLILDLERYVSFSGLNGSIFRDLLRRITPYYLEFKNCDRKDLISRSLKQLAKIFVPGERSFARVCFIRLSSIILKKYWNIIKYAKDNVIVALISVLSKIGLGIRSIKVSKILRLTNATYSSVAHFVKKRLLPRRIVPEFKGLERSSRIIRREIVRPLNFRIEPHQREVYNRLHDHFRAVSVERNLRNLNKKQYYARTLQAIW